jgi:hypothetical protein
MWMLALASTLLLLVFPTGALAATELVSSQQVSVTGVDAAGAFLRGLREVELGSEAATVTIEVEGVETPIAVDYAELTESASLAGDGQGGELIAPLLAGWVGLGALSRAERIARRLHRLLRR